VSQVDKKIEVVTISYNFNTFNFKTFHKKNRRRQHYMTSIHLTLKSWQHYNILY